MVELGYPAYGEAVTNLIQFIGSEGISQADLADHAGISKQAVQQQLDDLAAQGLVERLPDPKDARRNVVRFTPKGLETFGATMEVKFLIDAEIAALLGARETRSLRVGLRTIAEQEDVAAPTPSGPSGRPSRAPPPMVA